MAKRRGHGEGTIFQKDNGHWRAQVTLVDGRRVGKTFDTRREAQQWMTQTQKAIQDGMPVSPQRVTVGQLLDQWMADVAQHKLRPKTLESYESIIRVHIMPALGEVKLVQLRADQLQRFYTEKLESLSPRSVQYIHAILHRALRQAVRWELVARNVADAVEAPRPRRKQMSTLDVEQARKFLASVREDRLYALYVLAVMTGMREGELLGLHWAEVDLEKGSVRITTSMQRLWKQGMVATQPKTDRSRRMISVPPLVVAALRERRVRQLEERLLAGGKWKDQGLVFATATGTPMCPRSLLRQFHAALERAGLPSMRFHDLRHTAATLLLSQGTHPKVVQEMLGHSQISLTLDTYSHVLPTMQEEAVQKMQRLLG